MRFIKKKKKKKKCGYADRRMCISKFLTKHRPINVFLRHMYPYMRLVWEMTKDQSRTMKHTRNRCPRWDAR